LTSRLQHHGAQRKNGEFLALKSVLSEVFWRGKKVSPEVDGRKVLWNHGVRYGLDSGGWMVQLLSGLQDLGCQTASIKLD
jgi:hypothetical protein